MKFRLIVFAALFCANMPRVWAYTLTGSRWRSASVPMQLQLGASSGVLMDGFTSWGASAEDALNLWNTNINATKFSVMRDSTAARAEGNRINNVFFSADVYGAAWGAGVLAVTLTYTSGTSTSETDVLFNTRINWNSYRGPQRSSATGSAIYDFHRVALHEFGHVLGLDHPDDAGQSVTALMNSHVSSLDSLASDDITGAQVLYGAPATAAPTPAPTTIPIPTVTLPTIVAAPTSRSVTVGQSTTFSVSVSSSVAVTYQWIKSGVPIPNANGAMLTLINISAADAGTYVVTVSNSAGSVVSSAAMLTVTPIVTAPVIPTVPSVPTVPAAPTTPAIILPTITTQPVGAAIDTGSNIALSVIANGTAPLAYQWRKGGAALSGATNASFSITNARAADAGDYTVVVSNATGSIASSTATITVRPPVVPLPVISTNPVAQTVTAGDRVSLTVAATSTVALAYQWFKDGETIPGATATTFSLDMARPSDAGNYAVRVTNSTGAVTTPAIAVTVKFSRLVNLSTRALVPAGGALTPGFYVRGTTAKPLLIRAVGPTLSLFGVGSALAEAKLDVIAQASSAIVASNSDWGGSSALRNAFARVGAFPLAADSKDAAVETDFPPAGYTVRVTAGDSASSGVTLAEIYDADTLSGTAAQLVNVSALGFVGTGDNSLTAGFVISGNAPKRLLIRAIGPGLARFGVTNLLSDPQIGLVPFGRSEPTDTNDDWPDLASLRLAFTAAGAFQLTPGSKDSALVVTLEPGAYTVIVSGASGSATGNALVELYDLDP